MKKALLLLLMLLLGAAAVLGMFPWREAILAGASPAALLQPAPSPTPCPSPTPRPTPVPTPTPLAEDPAANARMASVTPSTTGTSRASGFLWGSES